MKVKSVLKANQEKFSTNSTGLKLYYAFVEGGTQPVIDVEAKHPLAAKLSFEEYGKVHGVKVKYVGLLK